MRSFRCVLACMSSDFARLILVPFEIRPQDEVAMLESKLARALEILDRYFDKYGPLAD
jgi:hypothetical protein